MHGVAPVLDRWPARIGQRLFAPVDIASLVAFRVLFGSVMFIGAVRFMLTGWVHTLFVQPSFFFKYPGFGWVSAWPAWGMYLHLTLVAAAALCVAIGFHFRFALTTFIVLFAYLELVDVTNYLNHYYLILLLAGLLLLTPAHRAWSLDAVRTPERATNRTPAWCIYLLRFQVGVLYFFAGLAKLQSDWLLHAQPLSLWLQARTDTPLLGPLLGQPWAPYLMSWAGFLYDTTIPFFLLHRRTRPFAYGAVLTFHALTSVFFKIGMFPLIMVTVTLIFFPPDWPRRLLRLMPATISPPRGLGWTRARRLGVALAAIYVLFQVTFPFRNWLYAGNVLWHEQGMRFSWRVLVREKHGSVVFHVRVPKTGRSYQVNPIEYLRWRQYSEMSGQPDLILQLAHHIARDFERRGFGQVEVRAEARVSLNGRAPALMVDPSVDLAKVEDSFARASWILPAPNEPPIRRRARVAQRAL